MAERLEGMLGGVEGRTAAAAAASSGADLWPRI